MVQVLLSQKLYIQSCATPSAAILIITGAFSSYFNVAFNLESSLEPVVKS